MCISNHVYNVHVHVCACNVYKQYMHINAQVHYIHIHIHMAVGYLVPACAIYQYWRTVDVLGENGKNVKLVATGFPQFDFKVN